MLAVVSAYLAELIEDSLLVLPPGFQIPA